MDADNRKQYWEGLCNRNQSFYNSLNQIRVTTFAFGVSLGGILIAQGPDYRWGGLMMMLVFMGISCFISSMAVNQWLSSRNIDLWLRIGDTTRNFEADYRMSIPNYSDLIFHRLPKREELKDAEVVEGGDWREAWLRILATDKRGERLNLFVPWTIVIILIVLILVIPSLS